MKKLFVDDNTYSLVDDTILSFLSQYKWRIQKGNYIYTRIDGKKVWLHKLILLADNKVVVDHIDNNPLNNQIINLRLATKSENHRNRKLNNNNTSGYKGVVKHLNRWRAQVRICGKLRYFGFYTNPLEAAKAYNKAAKEHFGEFAKLNTI